MAKILDREALIKTAVVEIKALTVSGKQVTLALFRQLQEERLIDPMSLQFKGVPWGRINYHPDGCADADEHMHVVWQLGAELRRSYIQKDGILGETYRNRALADRWLRAAMLQAMSEEEPTVGGKPVSVLDRDTDRTDVKIRVCEMESPASWFSCYHLRLYWESRLKGVTDGDFYYKWATDAALKREGCLPVDWNCFGIDECKQFFNEECSVIAVRSKRWAELYETLENLDQLFIAV